MRTLSTPVLFSVLLASSFAYGHMSSDEGHFSEPHQEANESQKGMEPMQVPTYPLSDHFPPPGGDNSESTNRPEQPEERRSSGSISRGQNGRQLPAPHHGGDHYGSQQTDFYLGQRPLERDYYRPGPSRHMTGRSETRHELNDAPGSSYDIYGVHEQARPVRPEYSRWPAEDGYNRGQHSADSRDSYQQYPQQSPYPYGQDRDYRPRQPEPVDVSSNHRYDSPSRYPSPQNYERPYETPSYS